MNNSTYTSTRPNGLTTRVITEAVALIAKNMHSNEVVAKFEHNSCQKFFEQFPKDSIQKHSQSISVLYGIPVIENKTIEHGIIRALSKTGRVICTFAYYAPPLK